MQIEDYIELYQNQAAESMRYMKKALAEGDCHLAACNMTSAFMEKLVVGLVYWRLGKDPTRDLAAALDIVLQGRELILSRRADTVALRELPLNYSIYLASLFDVAHPPLVINDYEKESQPGAFVGNVLIGASAIEGWKQYADKLPAKKRYTVARETDALYVALLAGDVSPEDGVKVGEKLFIRRAKDEFHKMGSVVEAGGDGNARLVDFRLAAVLKKIGSTVPTVHAWRW